MKESTPIHRRPVQMRTDKRKSAGVPAFLCVLVLSILPALWAPEQGQIPSEQEIWQDFTTWMRSSPERPTLESYGEKLAAGGYSESEVARRLEIIRRLLKEDPLRGVELTYDRIFSKPVTGDPQKDGFTSTPSAFLMESAKGLQPGRALDVGAGQGRNAVWLARQGWEVTAIDISGSGLAAAAANAARAGVRLTTVKTSYQDFDFGSGRWDLIVMILSWAPMSDPKFVARVEAGLRPGGILIFEHVLETKKQKFPPVVHPLPPNALLRYVGDLTIQYYEENVWQGDWGGPPAELVRLIASKGPARPDPIGNRQHPPRS